MTPLARLAAAIALAGVIACDPPPQGVRSPDKAADLEVPLQRLPVTPLALREVELEVERVDLDRDADVDVLLFGEPRPAFLAALAEKAPGVTFAHATVTSPSLTRAIVFGQDAKKATFVVAVERDGALEGPWRADDAAFRMDGALVLRLGADVRLQAPGAAPTHLAKTDLCVGADCPRSPSLLVADESHVAVSMESRGFITSSSLGVLTLRTGHFEIHPGMPGAHLGLAVNAAGTVCTVQVPEDERRDGAALACSRAPWTSIERFWIPDSGAAFGAVGDLMVNGVVGRLALLDPERRVLRVADTRRYRGTPTSLPAAGLVVLDLDDAYAIIDPKAGTVGVAKAPGCHNILSATGSSAGAFVASCERAGELRSSLLRVRRPADPPAGG